MEGHAEYLCSELWGLIFRRVDDGDLKAVSLVCKDFLTYSNPLKESLKVVHPDITMLSRHLTRFRQIKAIDLLQFKGDINKAIPVIEGSGISLESLDIPIDKQWGQPKESETLRGFGPNLKALNCRIRSDMDGYGLAEITNTFPNLEQLRIENYWKLSTTSGVGFVYLDSELKLLKKIHLHSCFVSDESLIALSLNCVLLKDVAISGVHYVTETGISHLLRNRPNLEALSFNTLPPGSSSINIDNSICHAKALTCLMLSDIRNTDKVLKAIAKAEFQLNILSLKNCWDLTDFGLLVVLSKHQLTKLSLLGSYYKHLEEVVLKGNISNLTHIEISGWQLKGTATLFLLLTRCPSLVDIRCTEAYVHDQFELDTTIPLSKNQKMTSLDLSSSVGINDEFLKQLGFLFPNLKVLNLSKICSLWNTCTGIEAILKSCKQITELNLCGYDKAKMLFVANDPELVELNLEVLTLSHSSIDDEGLAAIGNKCPRLLSLDLSECEHITTEGIKQVVQNIKTLTSLSLVLHYHCRDYGVLLEWMLSTGNFASLNKIFLVSHHFSKEQKNKFLDHGCLLLSVWRFTITM